MKLIQHYFADFTPAQLQQFAALKELYTEWNEKINVISRKDIDNFYEHHVLHSLSIATQFEFTKEMQVMDLAAGAVFPEFRWPSFSRKPIFIWWTALIKS